MGPRRAMGIANRSLRSPVFMRRSARSRRPGGPVAGSDDRSETGTGRCESHRPPCPLPCGRTGLGGARRSASAGPGDRSGPAGRQPREPGRRSGHWYTAVPAPVAQGIERCPAEAEAARSNRAGRIAEMWGLVGEPAPPRPAQDVERAGDGECMVDAFSGCLVADHDIDLTGWPRRGTARQRLACGALEAPALDRAGTCGVPRCPSRLPASIIEPECQRG